MSNTHRPRLSRRTLLAGALATGAVAACGRAAQTPPLSTAVSGIEQVAAPVGPVGPAGLPGRVVAGYWPMWPTNAIRLIDLPASYNVVHLFAAAPTGTAPGDVGLPVVGDGRGAAANLMADIATARTAQHRSVLLSVGGAGAGIAFDSRTTSTRFTDSLSRIIDEIGGLDGVDLNTFEADAVPAFDEYAWISRRLKDTYGAAFAVTCPPAPWRDTDRDFCRRMAAEGLLDLCGPQFYDGDGLAVPARIVSDVAEWVELVGEDRLYVGFGLAPGSGDYMTVAQCVSTWRELRAAHPGLRGAFAWNVVTDEAGRWAFADQLGPLVSG